MIKSKYFKVSLPMPLTELTEKLLSNSYTEESKSGFDLVSIQNEDTVTARFIEKISFEERMLDPYGSEIKYERVSFTIVEFEIYSVSSDRFVLKLLNPPRSIKSFVNKLFDISGFGFTLSNISIDITLFIEHLKELTHPHSIKVSKITAGGIRVTPTSSANVELVSLQDAYSDLITSYPNVDAENIKKAIIRMDKPEYSRTIEVSRTGMISHDEQFSKNLLSLIVPFVVTN